MKSAIQDLGRHLVSLGSFVWTNIKTTAILIPCLFGIFWSKDKKSSKASSLKKS